jgi:small subunit ribosomal protein S7
MDEKEKLKAETKVTPAAEKVAGTDLRTRQARHPAAKQQRQKRLRRPPISKAKPKREKTRFTFRLFGKWEPIQITDKSLQGYINMDARILPRSEGAFRGKLHKSKMHIVERLALKMMVSGHTGKKHKITSGKFAGNYGNVLKHVEKALEIIEQHEKKNPLEVLVKAIENAALREEVISYQLGSIIAREAVVTAPQRRIDKTLRYFAQSAYRRSFGKKKSLGEALADELIAAYRNSADSFAIKEKERIEREASGAR